MIEYVANYYGSEKRPYICKKFVSSSQEESHTAINVGNQEELENLSAELIYEHMQNVIKYLDEKMDFMTLIQLDELSHSEPWPIKGWSEVEWCQNEVALWWNYVYYKDYDQRAEAQYAAEYDAQMAALAAEGWEEETGHTHDPETGEEIPNEPTTTEETPQ